MTGTVIWFTGLPAAGKTTLARRVGAQLRQQTLPSVLLDSDEVRRELAPQLGYSVAERNTFYDLLARLAAMLARQGLIVLVAATAHQRRYRQWAREMAPEYYEVFVDVPAQECRERDPKGLYERAQTARASTLPGSGACYEPPETPDVRAAGGRDDVVDAVIALLGSRPKSESANVVVCRPPRDFK